MPQLFNAPIEVAGPTGGRRADASDVGSGSGFVEAGKMLSERSDVMMAAQARVTARRDIIGAARQDSNRSAWERENAPAAVNSDLTDPGNMQKALNVSRAWNAEALGNAKLSARGQQDLILDLNKRHETYANSLAKTASTQQLKLVGQVVQDGTNGYAALAAETPTAWRDLLALGDDELAKKAGAVSPVQIRAWQQGRTVVIMQAAMASFLDNDNVLSAVELASSAAFRRNFSPDQQRTAFVAIKVKSTATEKTMLTLDKFNHQFMMVNGEPPSKDMQNAVLRAHFKLKDTERTPANIIAELRLTGMFSGDQLLQIYGSLITDGKINDLGKPEKGKEPKETGYEAYLRAINQTDSPAALEAYKALPQADKDRYAGISAAPVASKEKKTETGYEAYLRAINQTDSPAALEAYKALPQADKDRYAGISAAPVASKKEEPKETGYEGYLRAMSLTDTPEARRAFDLLTPSQKNLYASFRKGEENRLIVPTKMDRVHNAFKSLFGVADFTVEQAARIPALFDFDFAKATVASLTSAYQQVYGLDPPQALMAEWGLSRATGDEVVLRGPGVFMAALGVANDIMDYYDDPAFTALSVRDLRTFESALYSMALGQDAGSDALGNPLVEKPELPRTILAFAKRMNVDLPPSYVVGRSIMEGPAANWQTSVVEQTKGLWARTPSFKGIPAAWEAFLAGTPFTGTLTPTQNMVVAFGTIAKSLRQNLIAAMRSRGGRMLAAERLDIVDILDGVLLPGGWADHSVARAKMTGLEMALAKQQEHLEKIALDTKGAFLRDRQNARALSNEIAEVRMLMGVPPIIATVEEEERLPAGLTYQIIKTDGMHIKVRKEK